MTNTASMLHQGDASFEDAEFLALSQLAKREFGLDLAESKKPLVYSRLSRRLKATGIGSFREYLALFEGSADCPERQPLISALTTNVTSFFREAHHFETLETGCLLANRSRIERGERFRIWSAGCSTGQEAFSIAMTVLAAWPEAANNNVRILATDIDPEVVNTARLASYSGQDAEIFSERRYRPYADHQPDGSVRMTRELQDMITFAELNLVSSWPFNGPFDAIFCRNVAIYFDLQTQQRLWQRFSELLTTGGFLFIGHSERVTGPASECLIQAGITSYRKVNDLLETQKNGALE